MPRDYKREYELYHSKPKQKKRRAERNSSRATAAKAGKVRKGDGKDVDHINRNTKSKKVRVVSKSTNRSFSRKGQGKGSKKGRRA